MAASSTRVAFTGCPIDRSAGDAARKDAAALQVLREGPTARCVLVWSQHMQIQFVEQHQPGSLVWHTYEEAAKMEGADMANAVYLGPMRVASPEGETWQVFVAELTVEQPMEATGSTQGSILKWLMAREVFMLGSLSADELAIMGLACAMTAWHRSAQFDGRSGKPTVAIEGGMKRQAVEGSAKLYPRVDPVSIGVIVSPDREKCLLGRSPNYPPGLYTCLSGFVEPCESVEEGFAREALEEAGVQVVDVTLVASQPWPIGRGGGCELMLGCRAVAVSEHVEVNKSEIEDSAQLTNNPTETQRTLSRGAVLELWSALT